MAVADNTSIGATGVEQNELDETAPSTDAENKLGDQLLFKKLQSWIKSDMSHRAKWDKQCEEDYKLLAGNPWSDEERRIMESQDRVPVSFNRVLTVIKAIAGSEINGRQDIQYLPRHMENAKQNELLSAASQWMGDLCDAEDEQSEAFENTLSVGYGCTECRISYDEDPGGLYEEKEIDPREMYVDLKARKRNFVDARRVTRVRQVSLAEARAMFPGFADADLDATWATDIGQGQVKPVEEKRHQDDNYGQAYGDGDDLRNEVTLVHIQWFEKEPYWLVADPNANTTSIMEKKEFDQLQARSQELNVDYPSVKLIRKVYKQAFLGAKILETGPTPVPDLFSFQFITCERDKQTNTWFGLVRVMRDPQKWANKMLSNALHIANTTAKGGIIAEKDSFDDERQAEDTYAQPNAITWAAAGAVKEGRIMPKPGAGDPSVYLKILEFAISSIRDVTGVNLELLGLRDADQPGVLEAQRKQAAMTVLASAFNSLRRFRKAVGRIRLHFIQTAFSDGRLVRVVGPDGAQAIPLMMDKTAGEYDVVVSDAPTSPNQKEANWAIINQILPTFKDMLQQAGPDVILQILEYSPLPTDFVQKLREVQAKMAPQIQQHQQTMEALQSAQISAIQSKAQRDQAAAQRDTAAAQATGMDGQTNAMIAQAGVQEAQARAAHAQAGAQKASMDAHTAMINAASTAQDAENKTEMNKARAMHDQARALKTLHEVGVAQSDAESASTMNEALIKKAVAETAKIMAETFDQKIETMIKVIIAQQPGALQPAPVNVEN